MDLRKEITCEEVEDENIEIEALANKIININIDATLTRPSAGSDRVTNTFKPYLNEQRVAIQKSFDVLNRVVRIAYAAERPLLASNQAFNSVYQ